MPSFYWIKTGLESFWSSVFCSSKKLACWISSFSPPPTSFWQKLNVSSQLILYATKSVNAERMHWIPASSIHATESDFKSSSSSFYFCSFSSFSFFFSSSSTLVLIARSIHPSHSWNAWPVGLSAPEFWFEDKMRLSISTILTSLITDDKMRLSDFHNIDFYYHSPDDGNQRNRVHVRQGHGKLRGRTQSKCSRK